MSEENVEVMRAAFEAIRRHDGEAFRRLYDPDIEWEDVSGLWGDWGTRRGRGDVQDAFRDWFEAFEEEVDFELEYIADAGDQVIGSVRVRARGRISGLVVNQVIHFVSTVHGGRAVRIRAYRERTEALEAAGLRE
jgi:ketosteroid isomerase-like protein